MTSPTSPVRVRGISGSCSRRRGCGSVEETALFVSVEHETFDDWWEPFELGVGPAGAYLAPLAPPERAALRERCRAILPPPPFTMTTAVWAARGSPTT